MKNKLVTCLILVMCAALMFTACAVTPTNEAPSTETDQPVEKTAEAIAEAVATPSGESFTIGCVMVSPDSTTTISLIDNVNNVIENMGGKVQWEDNWDYSPDGLITSVEKLITAGADGIMLFPPSDSVLPKIMQMCEDAGVYWAIFFRSINDEEVRNMVLNSKYYVGNIYEDEETAGYNMGVKLGEHGAKKVAIISTTKGDTTGDTREIGFSKACEEYGIEVVAEARALLQASDVTKAVESFIASYPDLDGIAILATLGTTIPPAAQAIKDADKVGQIVITCNDFTDNDAMLAALNDGILLSIAGGHLPYDPPLAAAMLYNTVQGTPLSESKMSIQVSFLYADSAGVIEDYLKYVEGDTMLYTPEEVSSMLNKATNANLTEADLQKIAADYTMDSIKARRGDTAE